MTGMASPSCGITAAVVLTLFTVVQSGVTIRSASRNASVHRQCTVPIVNKGETAVLTFFLRNDINLSRDKAFVHLRRGKDIGSDILRCEQNSPLKCAVTTLPYETDTNVADYRVTLRIPNVTKMYEDNYVLHLYINGTAEAPNSCHLIVRDKQCEEGKWECSNDNCIPVRWRCDERDDCGDGSDEENCEFWGCSQGKWKCKNNMCIPAQLKCDGRKDCSDGSDEENCVADKTEDMNTGDERDDKVWVITTVLILFVMVAGCLGAVFYCRRSTSKTDTACESAIPLLRCSKRAKAHKKKRWFVGNITEEDEKKLLMFKRNGEGSFLVKESDINEKNFVLAVLLEGGLKYLTIVPEENHLMCPSTGKSFPTLCDLVDHYREKDIRVKNTVWGTLSKPFEKEPEHNWYFGQLSEQHVRKILERSGEGAFMLTVSHTDEDGYDLSVHRNSAIHCFGIIPEDDGFRMLDTGKVFPGLTDVVDYYTHNDIQIDEGKSFGKLSTEPCNRDPEKEWLFETFTTRDETCFLESKRTRNGSFIIVVHSTSPKIYGLAVYSDKEMGRFKISQEGHVLTFLETGERFYSWHELVDHYRAHDIIVKDKNWGKLTLPYRKEPDEKWYVTTVPKADEEQLVKGDNKSGSYLVRDGVSDPDNYVLAVNVRGSVRCFTIFPVEDGFLFHDTGAVFSTLADLVQHYIDHDIKVDGDSYGKLVKPFEKVSTK